MAAGANRPYTVEDVIGSLAGQVSALSDTSSTTAGTGFFVEADEAASLIDTASVAAQGGNPAWNEGQWSAFTWG
jgi:hypothetical protein